MKTKAKRILAIVAVVALLLMFLLPLVPAELWAAGETEVELAGGYDYTRFQSSNITLNVYNWGEYMSLGVDGESLNVNAAFTQLTGIKVNYTNFDTNESLYSKLKSGGAEYDVIIPSDYMVGKMINEDMLAQLDFENIPNYRMIGDPYKDQPYDPDNRYSVPYTWGYVGLIYNTTMVEGEIDSWEALWDPAYRNNILMFDNSRDAFGIALKKIGLSLNPSSNEEIDLGKAELVSQKPLVQAYVMDQIFDKMEGGEAAVAPYYAGDAITMIEENPDLAFAVPKEGTNYFIDAMCIPKGSPNREAAEMYINFLCETQVAMENSMFIGYSTPQVEAEAAMPDDIKENPIAYPDEEVLANMETFNVLPDELNTYMDKAWSDMRSANVDAETGEETGGGWIIVIGLAAAVVLAIVVVVLQQRKKKRNSY